VGVFGRDKHNEACDGDNAEENHIGSALLRLISQNSTSDGSNATKDIGRDSHELRFIVRISHVLDDGWEEQRDGIQRSIDTYNKARSATRDNPDHSTYRW